jgi:hypothetical protein
MAGDMTAPTANPPSMGYSNGPSSAVGVPIAFIIGSFSLNDPKVNGAEDSDGSEELAASRIENRGGERGVILCSILDGKSVATGALFDGNVKVDILVAEGPGIIGD